ncbi:M61 family metallopeptidase [Gloeocapsopsis dulcis]|uniref:Peptidase M61 n=1 Tax=Gloeocapsopsis dulcis AAB1 = 1H9 TaxID=1433147 RepID=A0A6N8G2W5_9CHRO|nr:M61 family metallopeptidase [Gloeocapsopsis dulcis]MUL39192.1 peptidase M61 [Gloeocapsopsis dulcis AAB1 = 1H9]WNN90766.1 M61 family metallopeptidase [Gloeocapsopsis dulcis]
MTEATAVRSNSKISTTPQILYRVAMSQPESHLFEVSLNLTGWKLPVLDLKLPVWTPGSYLVREYAKHVQNFTATAGEKPLLWRKLNKNHWQVTTTDLKETITIKYWVFANELSVRTNHLDTTHGYFNGAALFFRVPEWETQAISVTIVPPKPDWQVTTPLPVLEPNTFIADDYDTLVDSPFEIGCHELHHFEVLGKSHELAIWSKGNVDAVKMIPDIQKIVQVEAEMFGGLPYEKYVFLLHLSSQGNGGLEHKYSCSLNYPRLGFRAKEKYDRFMQLVAHEFFHLWNVKRIRPKALEVFDYDRENYMPSLWFCEGTTSYYDIAIPLRAGIYDAKSFLNNLAKDITRLQTTPGRLVQPLSDSSWDAWIKLYRPDANSGNSQISYYLKGELVSFLLDLLIRERHSNTRSLDDVMRQMWQQFGKSEVGFTPEQLQQVIESVAETKLTDFFDKYIDGVEELPFNQYLEPFGLEISADVEDNAAPYLGIKAQAENGKEIIKFVEAGTPAAVAGIDAGDELLAIDGVRVQATHLSDRLKDYQLHDKIQITVFHQDELRTYDVTLAEPRPSKYQIVSVDNPSATQQQNFQKWLGVSLETAID